MGRTMKDSGIEWVGKIPQDWEQTKLKKVALFFNGDRGANYPSTDELVDDGVLFVTTNNIHGTILNANHSISKYITEKKYQLLNGAKIQIDDIVFCLRGSIGTCSINKSVTCGTVASSLCTIRATEISPDFLNYALHSSVVETQTNLFMNGTCAANLSASNVSNYFVFVPPVSEQKQIVDFLTLKCKKIDDAIEKTEKSIEEYKKLKQSIITEAVTKGIRGDRPMKNSGIKWIGEIPEDWTLVKIKHIILPTKDGIKIGPFGSALTNKTIDCGDFNVYSQANLISGDYSSTKNTVSKETFLDLKGYEVFSGDICLSMMGTIGKCKIVPSYIKPGIMDSHLIKIRLSNKILPEYFEYVYDKDLGGICYAQMQFDKKGSIMDGLNTSIVKNLNFPLPSISEQKEIITHLDKICTDLNELINNKQNLVSELENYKKSFIYEYVTGKKEAPECL